MINKIQEILESKYSVWLFVVITIILFAVLFVVLIKKIKNSRLRHVDKMAGLEFEHYCADLLEKNGFTEVQVTQASGDYGVDILAKKDGITYAIQCKRYSSPVGIKAIQEIYAGKDYYDCMVGAVMTNQYFTNNAIEAAKKLKVLLWNRDYLERLERG